MYHDRFSRKQHPSGNAGGALDSAFTPAGFAGQALLQRRSQKAQQRTHKSPRQHIRWEMHKQVQPGKGQCCRQRDGRIAEPPVGGRGNPGPGHGGPGMSRGEGILRRERNFQCHSGIHRTGAGSRDHIFQEQISHKIGDCHGDYQPSGSDHCG